MTVPAPDLEVARLRARIEELESQISGTAPTAESELLSAILATSVAAICVLDPAGNIVYANPIAETILGLKPCEIVERRYDSPEWRSTAVDGSEWADEQQPFTRVMTTGQPVHDVRHAIEWPDGQRKVLSIDGAPIKDADGAIAKLVFAVSDITERLRIEQQAQQSDAWLRIALEAAQMGVWSWQVETNEVRWSDEVAPLFGLTNQEFDGTYASYLELIHPDDRQLVADTVQSTLESDADRYAVEHRLIWPDGSEHWIEGRGRVLRDRDGLAQGITGAVADVTDRKSVELALRESEAAFRTLLETVPSYIVSVARDHTIRFLNRTAPHLEVADVIGCDVIEFMTEESHVDYARALDRAFATGELQEFESQALQPDGERGSFLVRIGPVKRGDAVESVTVVGVDITQLKRAEAALRDSQEQLRRAQRLESVGRLAGGVAHDFNNLLTVVSGCVDLIESTLDERSGLRDLVQLIGDSAARGAGLTRQLLAFARKQVVKPLVVDPTARVRAAGEMLQRLLGDDIELELRLTAEPWPIEIDPGQFEQVLVNLAINARDAMPSGGRLTIESTNLAGVSSPAGAAVGGDRVAVTVRDTGVGISDEALPFIFEPFFTTKPVGEGTGLGLATCFGVIRQAGGDLEVASELGQGTQFRVLLPRSTTAVAASPEAVGAIEILGGRGTILLVEDDLKVRCVTQAILQRAGYEVLDAGGGCEALELSESFRGRIDLLVSDVSMPKTSGPELARQLLTARPDLKVLLVTGYSTELDSIGEITDQRIHLLQKPYTGAELTEKIRELGCGIVDTGAIG